tara:strand:- start:3296 stop:3685 length:390 start_codon:yes stop_codon:yes gene_type:complete
MNKIWHPYWLWEDFQNGMYDDVCCHKQIEISFNCLTGAELFLLKGVEILKKWKFCCEENLSNIKINRKAWLGQAYCNFVGKSTERSTKKAWSLLSLQERNYANEIANLIVNEYEKRYYYIHKNLGKALL